MHTALSRTSRETSIYHDVSLCMYEGFMQPFADLETRLVRDDRDVKGYSFVSPASTHSHTVYYQETNEEAWVRPEVPIGFTTEFLFSHPASDHKTALRNPYSRHLLLKAVKDRVALLQAPQPCAVVLHMNTMFALGAHAAHRAALLGRVDDVMCSALMHLQSLRFLASIEQTHYDPTLFDGSTADVLLSCIVDACAMYYYVK